MVNIADYRGVFRVALALQENEKVIVGSDRMSVSAAARVGSVRTLCRPSNPQ